MVAKAAEINEELEEIKKDVEGCLNEKIHPDLTLEEKIDLLRDNVIFKKRLHDANRKLQVIHNRHLALENAYHHKKETGPKIRYKAMKGDVVDNMVAEYFNETNCPVPLERMGNGYYMFGTKKIFAKIINGKLVIRVGGGYMGIDEFI